MTLSEKIDAAALVVAEAENTIAACGMWNTYGASVADIARNIAARERALAKRSEALNQLARLVAEEAKNDYTG